MGNFGFNTTGFNQTYYAPKALLAANANNQEQPANTTAPNASFGQQPTTAIPAPAFTQTDTTGSLFALEPTTSTAPGASSASTPAHAQEANQNPAHPAAANPQTQVNSDPHATSAATNEKTPESAPQSPINFLNLGDPKADPLAGQATSWQNKTAQFINNNPGLCAIALPIVALSAPFVGGSLLGTLALAGGAFTGERVVEWLTNKDFRIANPSPANSPEKSPANAAPNHAMLDHVS